MIKIAIFASGSGTNAQRIIEYFQSSGSISVSMVLSNNPDAFVLQRARKLGVPVTVFSRNEFYETDRIPGLLQSLQVSFLVLAGFLWLIPENLLKAYPGKILNIHPALLPKYGGKGMYGMKVHQALIDAGDKESGITVHRVNEQYDEGDILFQAKCKVDPMDTAETLAMKIHELEHRYYPKVIEEVVLGKRQEARGTTV
jgi:phosphoribosylglycinamide formyltransferase 1